MRLVIVDYGVGNLGSIPNMLARIGIAAEISQDPAGVESADRLILPGVGAFDSGMTSLATRGLREPLLRALSRGVPTLGLCLGMHLLFDSSEEGSLPGLGMIRGTVIRFRPEMMDVPLPIPNMGWHDTTAVRADPMFRALEDEARFYYAHSYHARPLDAEAVVAVAEYGHQFVACVRRGSVVAAQFHPEKSHRFGLQFLRNFVNS